MLNKCTILVLLLVIGASGVAHSQTPVFSQYYASGMYLNPALAGVENNVQLGINHRSQWSAIDMPFKTSQLSFIYPLVHHATRSKSEGGLGFSILHDQAGPHGEFQTQSISGGGAYNFHLNKRGSVLAVGGQISGMQTRINSSGFMWSSQYVAGYGFDSNQEGESLAMNEKIFTPVFSSGAMLYHAIRNSSGQRITVYQGLAISNVQRSKSFFYSKTSASVPIYKMHGGMSIPLSDNFDVSPNYLIQYQSDLQFNAGGYAGYRLKNIASKVGSCRLLFGLWYRWRDAFIISSGFESARWNFGFSYDTNRSYLGRNLGNVNAYEVSLTYKISGANNIQRFSSPLM